MKILLIEDDAEMAATLAEALTEEGYAVDSSYDGKEGLKRALKGSYDLLILDLMLPTLEGSKVLRQLRRAADTPVLVLTARHELSSRVGELEAGADDYLTKPFELVELLARLRALLRRAAGAQQQIVSAGNVQIHLRRRMVHREGAPVELTHHEYLLLEALALRAGRVVPRRDLEEGLQAAGGLATSSSLEVLVSRLRHKLGKNTILTRRGLGYELVSA